MNTGIIAIVIIVIMLVLYIIDKFPIPLVTVSGMLAMIFANIISYNDAFNSFVGSSVVRIFGMIIIINALMESGVITWVKKFFLQMTDKGEKIFLIILFLAIGIFSMFANNSALVAIFMPFVASIARTGKIKNKNLFMPIGMGSIIGGTGTLVGCTSITLASEALANNGAKELGFFTTAPITLIVLAVVAVCYYLFLYKLQNKWFDFEEKDMNMNEENTSIDKRKAIISLIVFFTSVICFAIKPFGWNNGLIAVALVVILMLTKCVEPRKELSNMNWEMLIVLGATIAIADGFTKSGAGNIIIDSLVSTFGAGIMQPAIMIGIFMLIGWGLSMFFSNGNFVSLLCSIAIPLAMQYGINPTPVAIACLMGCCFAMGTPIASVAVTMVQGVGYRFKDYFRIGGLVGLIGVITAWASIVLIYGLI